MFETIERKIALRDKLRLEYQSLEKDFIKKATIIKNKAEILNIDTGEECAYLLSKSRDNIYEALNGKTIGEAKNILNKTIK